MKQFSVEREFGFILSDVARLLRTYADQRAREFGMTRAQWAVLFRLERSEGMKQSELAEILDIQPITLTRLIDRLCDNGLIERRNDPNDRRAKRLFLLPAAKPVLAKLSVLGQDLISDALAGLDQKGVEALVGQLDTIKDNLRQAIADRAENAEEKSMADPAIKAEQAPKEPAAKVDPLLKVVPKLPPSTRDRAASAFSYFKRYRRPILLGALPALALLIGLTFYLMGGRYITTDNAYIGAQKVLITPDVAGKIINVFVREGQHVNPSDRLFEIDPEPYRLALTQAKAKLNTVETQFNTLKSDYKVLSTLVDFSQKSIELKQRDVERKRQLVESRSGSQADMDNSLSGLVTAQLQSQLAVQRKEDTLNQLMGKPDLPLDEFPAYAQAKAVLEQAQRDLDHTMLRAPIGGIATQVDNIQLGRFIGAGNPILSIIDDLTPWVDANPKETDITYLRVGQRVTIEIDTFPEHVFHGSVVSVSPGTGAQFSILPAQNASGNWIKVVQRVPLRIAFDAIEDTSLLRSGMSANVEIDTGRNRSLLTLFGFTRKPSLKTSVP